MPNTGRYQKLLGIPYNVWLIGFVTFLKNISSVVLVIFCPFYLSEVLCLEMSHLGILEGGVEAASFFSRILSGTLSDSLQKRKPVLMLGYSFSLLARLFLSLSSSVTGIVFSRTCERLGNGIQASPRDALVGDFTTPQNRGACFGLRQSLTVAGSVVGAFCAMWFMRVSNNNYGALFYLTLIPSALAILVLGFFVKDATSIAPKDAQPFSWKRYCTDIKKDIQLLPRTFWKITILSTLSMLSNFGIFFLTKKASTLGLSTADVPMVMVIQSLSTAFFAFPIGYLADKLGRRRMLTAGLICLALGNFGMAAASHLWQVYLCVILWGIQLSAIYNSLSAYVTDITTVKIRGTGFGVIQFCNGVSTLVANILTGYMWQHYGEAHAFSFNGYLPLLTLLTAIYLLPSKKRIEPGR